MAAGVGVGVEAGVGEEEGGGGVGVEAEVRSRSSSGCSSSCTSTMKEHTIPGTNRKACVSSTMIVVATILQLTARISKPAGIIRRVIVLHHRSH